MRILILTTALSCLLCASLTAAVGPMLVIPHPHESTTDDEDKPHYGDPKTGCRKDEQSFRIEGVPGSICSPKCAFGQCPGDAPDGVTATPQCALQTPDGNKYCALLCTPAQEDAAFLRGWRDCGPATCQPVQGMGICTYDM